MRTYLEFLRTPYASRLLGGTLLGRLPNGMGALAIVLFTRAQGGGYSLAGALAAAHAIAMAAGQPVLGRLMDRLGQPRVLPSAAGLAAAGFVTFAVVGIEPTPVAAGAVVLAGLATPPLEAGLRALWTAVLPGPAQIQTAFALDAASQEIIFTTAPLLVVAAATVSPAAAVVLTGALGVVGTLVVTTSRPSRTWQGEPRAADWAGPLRSPGLRMLLLSLASVGVALGALSVAVVPYAESTGMKAAAGILLAANAGGALTGGLVYGARPRRAPAHRRLPVLLTGLAAGYLPLMAAPGLAPMLVLSFLSGVFLAPTLACAFTLVDELAPRGTVTEAFAWIVAAMGSGFALGSAATGVAGDHTGVSGAFAVAAFAGVLALAICLLGHRLLITPPAEHPVPGTAEHQAT